MHAEFNLQFAINKRFDSKEELRKAVSTFGRKFNVVFSIKNSHPKNGEFHYICKHGGMKRDRADRSKDLSEIVDEIDEEIETIDTTVANNSGQQTSNQVSGKQQYKKSTQKFNCPAFFKLYDLTVRSSHMLHNHPVSQDVTTYALHRKQSPEVMERIYSILSGGHKDPVSSVMEVSEK